MRQKLKIKNIFGEKLDCLVEGNVDSDQVVIFVHGYGTDKDEGFASFLDLADYLQDEFLLLRFDLSGYGQSEGDDYEFNFHKATADVDSVIRYVRRKYLGKEINIIAHSMGTFVVMLLSPYGVRKVVFTSIVNSNVKFISRWLERRILSKGGQVDKDGISVYPRTKGGVQKIGRDFWRTLENFEPAVYLEELKRKTDLIVFKPRNDDVLPDKYFEVYKQILGSLYVEVEGDHNFRDPQERLALFKRIRGFLVE